MTHLECKISKGEVQESKIPPFYVLFMAFGTWIEHILSSSCDFFNKKNQ
jgi:hypothetical protein